VKSLTRVFPIDMGISHRKLVLEVEFCEVRLQDPE
jgi:hypothetical protein